MSCKGCPDLKGFAMIASTEPMRKFVTVVVVVVYDIRKFPKKIVRMFYEKRKEKKIYINFRSPIIRHLKYCDDEIWTISSQSNNIGELPN